MRDERVLNLLLEGVGPSSGRVQFPECFHSDEHLLSTYL
jgi:hypothetical protein